MEKMIKKSETNDGAENVELATEWDMSDVGEFRAERNDDAERMKAGETLEEVEKDELEETKFWGEAYRDTEQQFAEYQKTQGLNGGLRSEGFRRNLLKYEEDLSYNWRRLSRASGVAMSKKVIQNMYQLAEAEDIVAVEPEETIEAASGVFFDERMEALVEKIKQCSEGKRQEANLERVHRTWGDVLAYIEAAHDYETLHRNYEIYQLNRQRRHNEMIRQLNMLNDMAVELGTKRFTVRNFTTNDFVYHKNLDRGGKLEHKINYDRETVLAYFQRVYGRSFDQAVMKSKRASTEW